MAFWVAYDFLGRLVVANLLCMLVLLLPSYFVVAALLSGDPWLALLVGGPAFVAAAGLFAPILAAGLAHMIKEFIDTRDGSLWTFFAGVRRYAWRAMGVGLLFTAAAGCLGMSVWFYGARLGETLPWLGYALSALALWALLMSALAAMLAVPALVQKRAGVFETVKLAYLLVLDNPLFCLGLALNVAALAGLAMMPPVLLLFSISPLMVLLSSAYEMLSRKYAAIEDKRSEAAAEGRHLRVALRDVDFRDEEDDYLNRGIRDALFPWKQ